MFKRSDTSIVDRARRFVPVTERPGILETGETGQTADGAELPPASAATAQFHPPRAASQVPEQPVPGGVKAAPDSVVRSIRSEVVDRLGSAPPSAFVEQEGLVTRLRRRYEGQGSRLLVIAGAGAIGVVALVAVIPVLGSGHSSSKSPAAPQPTTAAATDAGGSYAVTVGSPTVAAKQATPGATSTTGFRGTGPVLPVAKQGAAQATPGATATSAAAVATGTAGAGYVQVNAPKPSTTPPLTRARSAPFQPPAAGATNPNQPPPVAVATVPAGNAGLTGIVTNAASAPPPVQVGSSSPGVVPSFSSAPPPAASSGGSGSARSASGAPSGGGGGTGGSSTGATAAAAPPQAPPPDPAAVAPALGSAASSAQRAAAAAAAHNQPASR